jgi:predicted transcriptional regulator
MKEAIVSGPSKKNLHVPLPPELHAGLKSQAQRVGEPVTVLARRAIEEHLIRLQREQLAEAIGEYADAMAGTGVDLDEDFEAASLETWEDLDR